MLTPSLQRICKCPTYIQKSVFVRCNGCKFPWMGDAGCRSFSSSWPLDEVFSGLSRLPEIPSPRPPTRRLRLRHSTRTLVARSLRISPSLPYGHNKIRQVLPVLLLRHPYNVTVAKLTLPKLYEVLPQNSPNSIAALKRGVVQDSPTTFSMGKDSYWGYFSFLSPP